MRRQLPRRDVKQMSPKTTNELTSPFCFFPCRTSREDTSSQCYLRLLPRRLRASDDLTAIHSTLRRFLSVAAVRSSILIPLMHSLHFSSAISIAQLGRDCYTVGSPRAPSCFFIQTICTALYHSRVTEHPGRTQLRRDKKKWQHSRTVII